MKKTFVLILCILYSALLVALPFLQGKTIVFGMSLLAIPKWWAGALYTIAGIILSLWAIRLFVSLNKAEQKSKKAFVNITHNRIAPPGFGLRKFRLEPLKAQSFKEGGKR